MPLMPVPWAHTIQHVLVTEHWKCYKADLATAISDDCERISVDKSSRLEMRPTATLLLLAIAAVVIKTSVVGDVANRSRLVLNKCTACHLVRHLKQNNGLLSELTQYISARTSKLPEVSKRFTEKATTLLAKKVLETPLTDCQIFCKAKLANETCCEEILKFNDWVSANLQNISNVVYMECSHQPNATTCLEARKKESLAVSPAVGNLVHELAALADPSTACGLDNKGGVMYVTTVLAPATIDVSIFSPCAVFNPFQASPRGTAAHTTSSFVSVGEFLKCQLCYSFLQFLNTVVAEGKTRTSQEILAEIGEAVKDVCVLIDLPALLHVLQPELGDLNCDGMPELITVLFNYVLSPMIGPQARETCTKVFPYCGEVYKR